MVIFELTFKLVKLQMQEQTNEFLSVQFDFLDPSGSTFTADVIFYLVVYGIEGKSNNVHPEVFS